MSRKLDLVGETYGRLVVLAPADRDEKGRSMWTCRCSCGVVREVLSAKLRRGAVKSCGCMAREHQRDWGKTVRERGFNTTHGLSRTPTHESWNAMMQRCTNPKHVAFGRYGGAGIVVCERWSRSFAAFVEDMGIRPDGLTLDRIDSTRGYEPGNVRWASRREQNRNKKGVILDAVIASQIRWLRTDGGFTNSEVAEAFGIARQHVCAITSRRCWND